MSMLANTQDFDAQYHFMENKKKTFEKKMRAALQCNARQKGALTKRQSSLESEPPFKRKDKKDSPQKGGSNLNRRKRKALFEEESPRELLTGVQKL